MSSPTLTRIRSGLTKAIRLARQGQCDAARTLMRRLDTARTSHLVVRAAGPLDNDFPFSQIQTRRVIARLNSMAKLADRANLAVRSCRRRSSR